MTDSTPPPTPEEVRQLAEKLRRVPSRLFGFDVLRLADAYTVAVEELRVAREVAQLLDDGWDASEIHGELRWFPGVSPLPSEPMPPAHAAFLRAIRETEANDG